MTQVPEYLLERSRARRAALGLDGDAPSPDASSSEPPAEASAPADAPAASATPTVAEAAAPAPSGGGVATAAPPAPADLPDYIRDPGPRSGIPYWMMPILLILPLWGVVYMGAFGEVKRAELTGPALGAAVYTRACASCHGAQGEGGVGPKLSGGEARKTFPNEAEHIAWVEQGSAARRGQPYGDPAREGGPKVAASGGMPGFAGQLTPAEIAAVVVHEREGMG